MEETYVRLLCPDCNKAWEARPEQLPDPDVDFSCPDCGSAGRTAEFARTEHDLRTLKNLG
jgi:predicted RNA-binding Zn-ribbon protein involved in translation (DUF1610 family)